VREQTASGQEVSLLDMLIVLAKRKRLIAGTTVAAALLALIVCFLIPDRYKATATLLPPQQQQSLASTMASQLSSGVAVIGALAGKDLGGLKNPSDLYVGLLKSRSVADALVQRFALMDVYHRKQLSDARSRLEKATEIEAAKNGFITVSVEDKDRKRAAAIANGYVEELRRLTSTIAVSEAGQRRLFFEQQLRKAKDDLADAEIAYKETEEKTGVIHMDTQLRCAPKSPLHRFGCRPCAHLRPVRIPTLFFWSRNWPDGAPSWQNWKNGKMAARAIYKCQRE
jgi:uncharacterized protein involved in exopolysaccharide biosynthesis